ncbi:MAG: carboxylating nicotinate-nucleotide diphosphorylase [Gammaproteobacteria bacterium]|jgi:nicotinate-nucleotide pyrophosphorylase (carboxylating)|nr:carboxylating nicotinate-nucleotide diphosphorylase [Gammaproteobacteria bacterium]MBT7308575.1 carboxylating nicotinate-nucleotide diphosphorylase [Gammaproteobacteria bacterium]
MNPNDPTLQRCVAEALEEDIRSGDITAQLIPAHQRATATILTREPMVLCGIAWVERTFHQLDPGTSLQWQLREGESAAADQPLLMIEGNARNLLTAERTAMNFLQTLSATATTTRHYVEQLGESPTQLLDTRKTLPGLRAAQKYAVQCGGGYNHRMGLYDAFLIKENHIAASGSIAAAVSRARTLAPERPVEVEVESLDELAQALEAECDTIMLDNFTLTEMEAAVALSQQRVKLEVSGNVSVEQLRAIAATGVDYISIGALTKHIRAIDLSMRLSRSE